MESSPQNSSKFNPNGVEVLARVRTGINHSGQSGVHHTTSCGGCCRPARDNQTAKTMKFCKNLQRVVDISDPEWAPYWPNYKMLKVRKALTSMEFRFCKIHINSILNLVISIVSSIVISIESMLAYRN